VFYWSFQERAAFRGLQIVVGAKAIACKKGLSFSTNPKDTKWQDRRDLNLSAEARENLVRYIDTIISLNLNDESTEIGQLDF